MVPEINEQDLSKFIVVGDRLLIQPKDVEKQTKSGLYLPPNVHEKEKIHQGYVIKTGPGYPIPAVMEEEEPWKSKNENVRYVPLQAQEGDLAIYIQNNAFEIDFNNRKYVIVPQSAVLMLIRDEGLFE